MEETGGFRHELKYQITCPQYLELRSRLRAVMRVDPHAGADGTYRIRSIYFDNLKDQALREKIDGLPRREKFRIRYYDDDLSFITLEKKIRDHGLSKKISVRITEDECRRLLEGDPGWMMRQSDPLVQELYVKMRHQLLRPKVLVSYVREPYVYPAGNVRVTFDSQIRTTVCGGMSFWDWMKREDDPAGLPKETGKNHALADAPGKAGEIHTSDDSWDMILEIKYDAFLPEVIRGLLQMNAIRQQAFSKYVAGRRYG